MATARGRTRRYLDIWPGYVDVLSTLLMVIIFTLMVFVIGQFFLTQVLSGRNKALAELNQHASELADMLSLEKTTNTDLRSTISQLSNELQQSNAAGDKLQQQLNSVQADRDQLASLLADLKAKSAAQATAKAEVDAKLEDAYKTIEADSQKVQTLLGDIAVLESLRDQLKQQLASSTAQASDLQQKLTTSQSQASDLQQQLSQSQSQASDLKQQLDASASQVATLTQQLGNSQALTSQDQQQIDLLNSQLLALRDQLGKLTVALDASEAKAKADEVQVFDLGKRLNEALASKVEELARYRSEFFGKLREVLGNRPDVQVVGDRFVFQSEVLFETGSADIGDSGKTQLAAFAATLKDISAKIPTDIDWILRVDGHTDKRAYSGTYGDNWGLSTARAIAVVKFLIDQGLPPNRLAATGFGEFRPLVEGETEDDFKRNRRIELKLDQR
jgi:chemotaxis protein MotB